MKFLKSLGLAGATAMLVLGMAETQAFAAQAGKASGETIYSYTNTNSGSIETGVSSVDREVPPETDLALRCWNPHFSGPAFSVTCSAPRWWAYVVCSNGLRLTAGPFAGTHRVTLVCPAGTRAVRGGAFT